MSNEITIYGAEGCADTARTRAHLEQLGVVYRYVAVDGAAEAEAFVKSKNQGKRKTPTVVLAGESASACGDPTILSVPSDSALDAALDQRRLLPLSEGGDGSPGVTR